MTFEEFEAEVQSRRAFGIIMGTEVLPNVLSPEALSLSNFRAFQALKLKRENEIAGEPTNENDKYEILEVRRRLVDIVEEAAEIGII